MAEPEWRCFVCILTGYSSLNSNLRLEGEKKKNSEKNCKSILFGNDNTSLSAAKLNDRLAEFWEKASPIASASWKVNLPWPGKINLSRALLALSRRWFREAHSIPRKCDVAARGVIFGSRRLMCCWDRFLAPLGGKKFCAEQGWRNAKVFLVLFICFFSPSVYMFCVSRAHVAKRVIRGLPATREKQMRWQEMWNWAFLV